MAVAVAVACPCHDRTCGRVLVRPACSPITYSDPDQCLPGFGLCEVYKSGQNQFTIGAYGPYEAAMSLDPTGNVTMLYTNNAAPCPGSSTVYSATITFQCNPSLSPPQGVPAYVREDASQCHVYLRWTTAYACPKSVSGSTIALSLGSIILVLLFVPLTVYIILGAIIQSVYQGAKGLDRLPNREFWGAVLTNIRFGFLCVFCPWRHSYGGSTPQLR